MQTLRDTDVTEGREEGGRTERGLRITCFALNDMLESSSLVAAQTTPGMGRGVSRRRRSELPRHADNFPIARRMLEG